MCLYIHSVKTYKAKKNKTGKVVRWKVVSKYPVTLHSIYQFLYKWKPGWNRSNRKRAFLLETSEVNQGIHVFTTRKEARTILRADTRIIKVICHNKDLVAVGWDRDEVYTKVFLLKDEYDSALKRNSVERR